MNSAAEEEASYGVKRREGGERILKKILEVSHQERV
jgi:hypothetical protein